MHGNHSLLNLDLAQIAIKEQIAAAERHRAIALVSNRSSRSRLSDVRRVIGSSLISAGERLRPVEYDLPVEELEVDLASLKLAR